MTTLELNAYGLTSNIVGTIILAYSLSRYLNALKLATMAAEAFMLTFGHPGGPIHFAGTDEHVIRGRRVASRLSVLGVVFVITGFVFQLCAVFKPAG